MTKLPQPLYLRLFEQAGQRPCMVTSQRCGLKPRGNSPSKAGGMSMSKIDSHFSQ
jgi:hypothetical protein